MNKVILIGNVGKEPEIRVAGETKVAQFSVATTERGFTTKDGKKIEDRTEWHNIVAEGLLPVGVYPQRTTVAIEETHLRSYEKDGTRYITEVVVEYRDTKSRKANISGKSECRFKFYILRAQGGKPTPMAMNVKDYGTSANGLVCLPFLLFPP